MNHKQLLAKAQEQDLNRQRQIEAQRQSINRLLAARESGADDATLISQLQDGREKDSIVIQELQAKLQEIGRIVANWNETARDDIVSVLGRADF